MKVEKTTKNYQQTSLQLATLMKEIERNVKSIMTVSGEKVSGGDTAIMLAELQPKLDTFHSRAIPMLEDIRTKVG